MVDDDFANRADRQGTIQRRGGAFAGNIAQRDSQASVTVGEESVKVSTQFTRRNITSSQIEARHFARAGGKKLTLNLSRGIEIAAQPALVLARFFIEPRVLECDGDIGTKRGKHALMFRGESVRVRAFQIENTDETVLDETRHNKFRTRFHPGFAPDVPGIVGDVVDAEDAAFSRSRTRYALVKRHSAAHQD